MLKKHDEERKALEAELEKKRQDELKALEDSVRAEVEKEPVPPEESKDGGKNQSALVEILRKEAAGVEAQSFARLRHDRAVLREEQAQQRAMKEEELMLGGASSAEVARSMEKIKKAHAEAIKAMETKMDNELKAALEAERKKEKEALKKEADPRQELRRLKNNLSKANDALLASLETDARRQRDLLADRLEKKRKALEAKMKRDGASPEQAEAVLDALVREATAERTALEERLTAEAAKVDEQCKQIQSDLMAQGADPAQEVARLRQLHDNNMTALQASIDEKRKAAQRRLK